MARLERPADFGARINRVEKRTLFGDEHVAAQLDSLACELEDGLHAGVAAQLEQMGHCLEAELIAEGEVEVLSGDIGLACWLLGRRIVPLYGLRLSCSGLGGWSWLAGRRLLGRARRKWELGAGVHLVLLFRGH